MTPHELAARLRAAQLRTQTLAHDSERIVQAQVLQGIPRTVSVQMTRTPSGVRVLLSGAGARRHARSVAPKMRAALKQSLRGIRP